MDWLNLAAALLRLIGFIRTAEDMVRRREEKRKAEEIANAPISNEEEIGFWDNK